MSGNRMGWATRLAVALALGGMLVTALAHATTLVHMSTSELTRASDDVVIGDVLAARGEWTTDRRIVTRVTIRVRERLKGQAAGLVEVVQLGGEVDGVKVTVPGCPTFRPGEQALLFLAGSSSSRRQVTGLAQGKFDIAPMASGRPAMAMRRTPGFETSDSRELRVRAGGARHGVPLDSLVAEIRHAVEGER